MSPDKDSHPMQTEGRVGIRTGFRPAALALADGTVYRGQAFGAEGVEGRVPPGATVVFEVELLAVE